MLETVRYKLNRFFDWLEEEATGWKVVKIIFLALLIKLVYGYSADFIASFLRCDIPGNVVVSSQPVANASIAMYSFDMVGHFLVGAVFEELFFRFMPLFLVILGAMIATGSLDIGVKTAFVFAIPVSVFFGYLHGGVENIFLQGVGGMIYSIIFLKLGGAQEKFFRGWFYISAMHFSFNMSVALIGAIYFGNRYITGLQ